MYVSELINRLTNFWIKEGCSFLPSYEERKGAGTLNLNIILSVLKEKGNFYSIERCARPNDGLGITKGCRLFTHTQFEVLMNDCDFDHIDLFKRSMQSLGVNNIELFDSNWEHLVLDARGLGWEAKSNNLEFCQITHFLFFGGIKLNKPVLEFAYGIERIAMLLQKKDSVFDLQYDEQHTYADIFSYVEKDFYIKQNIININESESLFNLFFNEANKLFLHKCYILALENILKCSHILNEIDEYLSIEKRQMYIIKLCKTTKIILDTLRQEVYS